MMKPVIFRKYADGELVAILPTVPAGGGKTLCLAFAETQGRISVDNVGVMRSTTTVTDKEAKKFSLSICHLLGPYGPLDEKERIKEHMNEERLKALKHFSKAPHRLDAQQMAA